MQTIKIIDADGATVRNKTIYGFVDPTTNHRFDPGVEYKVKVSSWMRGQPGIFDIQEPEAASKAPATAPAAGSKTPAAAAKA